LRNGIGLRSRSCGFTLAVRPAACALTVRCAKLNQVDDSIEILLSCLCARRYLGRGQVEIEPEKLRRFLLKGFAAMNSIFDKHGFPESELRAMSDGVIEVVEQAGMV
jgi:hypothetical protein